MTQKQCPSCGALGCRVDDRDLGAPWAQPHADGSACVCRHVSCGSRLAALRDGGRYWDGRAGEWICPVCGTAPGVTPGDVAGAVEAAGWSVSEIGPHRIVVRGAAPDSDGADTAPGSEWYEETGRILAAVEAAVQPLGWVAQWSDDDLIVEDCW